MELFIEKEFLDDFYIAYDSSSIDNAVKAIITNYGDKKVFIIMMRMTLSDLKVKMNFLL